MVLYRYLKSHWIETLMDGRFRLTNPTLFNDSFDFSAGVIGKMKTSVVELSLRKRLIQKLRAMLAPAELSDEQRKKIEEVAIEKLPEYVSIDEACKRYERLYKEVLTNRKIVAESYNVLCFSRGELPILDDVKMWDAYAGGGNGVRIGLECDDVYDKRIHPLVPIRYADERIVLDLGKITNPTRDSEVYKLYDSLPFTKRREWAYEKEYRLLCLDADVEIVKGVNYWRFDPALIKRLDLGVHLSSMDKDKISSIMREKYSAAEIYYVTNSDEDYAITYNKLNV